MCRSAGVRPVWDALIAAGGKPVPCDWLKDKHGFSWQSVPQRLMELLADPDKEKGRRAMLAMFGMVQLDIAALVERI